MTDHISAQSRVGSLGYKGAGSERKLLWGPDSQGLWSTQGAECGFQPTSSFRSCPGSRLKFLLVSPALAPEAELDFKELDDYTIWGPSSRKVSEKFGLCNEMQSCGEGWSQWGARSLSAVIFVTSHAVSHVTKACTGFLKE